MKFAGSISFAPKSQADSYKRLKEQVQSQLPKEIAVQVKCAPNGIGLASWKDETVVIKNKSTGSSTTLERRTYDSILLNLLGLSSLQEAWRDKRFSKKIVAKAKTLEA